MSDFLHLAEALTDTVTSPVLRVGEVTAVDTGPPVMVTIDNRPMRCYFAYTTPVVGNVVVWLSSQSLALALGPRL